MLNRFRRWLAGRASTRTNLRPKRGQLTHVVILDGTLSTLDDGHESNAGLTYKLLCQVAGQERLSLMYEAGIQWQSWKHTWHVAAGVGINQQIRRAYGFIASRYHPGDRIFLIGYSRGAFAVRSLAGVIDRVGLLRAECATERNIRDAYRHYQIDPKGKVARAFAARYCHAEAPIEMVGVWDTVRALGLRWPIVWRFFPPVQDYHDTRLGHSIRHGFHALAMDETRDAFAPALWEGEPEFNGRVEQVWFRGSHGDVGGQLGGFEAARPLSNIPLVWMLGKAEACGLPLPGGWRTQFPCDPRAPSVGTFRGWGKMFLYRHRRRMGRDPSEKVFALFSPGRIRGRAFRKAW